MYRWQVAKQSICHIIQKAGFLLVELSFAQNVREKRHVVVLVRALLLCVLIIHAIYNSFFT